MTGPIPARQPFRMLACLSGNQAGQPGLVPKESFHSLPLPTQSVPPAVFANNFIAPRPGLQRCTCSLIAAESFQFTAQISKLPHLQTRGKEHGLLTPGAALQSFPYLGLVCVGPSLSINLLIEGRFYGDTRCTFPQDHQSWI